MAYSKPIVVELSNPVKAILGSTTKQFWYFQLDGDLVHFNALLPAYEADE